MVENNPTVVRVCSYIAAHGCYHVDNLVNSQELLQKDSKQRVVGGDTHEKIYWRSWYWTYMLFDSCYLMERKKSGEKRRSNR